MSSPTFLTCWTTPIGNIATQLSWPSRQPVKVVISKWKQCWTMSCKVSWNIWWIRIHVSAMQLVMQLDRWQQTSLQLSRKNTTSKSFRDCWPFSMTWPIREFKPTLVLLSSTSVRIVRRQFWPDTLMASCLSLKLFWPPNSTSWLRKEPNWCWSKLWQPLQV